MIFAFPSLDEGFGMPVLDAMAAGVPVVSSNRAALPEVCGDAAILVDPEDTGQLADVLCRLCRDEALRLELERKGTANASRFSWKRAIARTFDVYRELLVWL
jgi:glycosyltransferase involved in cell wall biosynthesis